MENALARCVSDIRIALDDREQRIIKTVPGRGYMLAVPVIRASPDDARPRAAVPPEASVLPIPDRPTIAVLPFTNLNGLIDQDVFSDGLTEQITSALCRLKSLFVIARNTMFTYKGRSVDIRALGRELGVRYVLEGSVRKSEDSVRVTAQLLETATGSHIWAERYERRLEGIFAIQDDITSSIVGRIGPELLVAEYARAARKPVHNLDAWECVIRALSLCSQQSQSASRDAIGLLDRALAINPGHAQALGMKAWILVFRAFQGWDDMRVALGEATTLIAGALAEDNDEPWVQLAQGMVGFAARDNALSVSALSRAVAISPNMVNAHGLLGIAHAFGGRSAEALASIDHAVRLSRRDTYLSDFELYYAFAHFQAANYARALDYARQAHRMRPGHPYPLVLAAACAGHAGEIQLGRELLAELATIVPVVSADWVEMTSPYIRADDRARFIAGLRCVGLV